jgi:hypothetical protein
MYDNYADNKTSLNCLLDTSVTKLITDHGIGLQTVHEIKNETKVMIFEWNSDNGTELYT